MYLNRDSVKTCPYFLTKKTMKKCSKCKKEKKELEFFLIKGEADYYCKECRRENGRKGAARWKAKYPERFRESCKRYYEKNRVRIIKQRIEYQKKNKEKYSLKAKERYAKRIGKTMKVMSKRKEDRIERNKEVKNLYKTMSQSDIARKLGVSRYVVWDILNRQ